MSKSFAKVAATCFCASVIGAGCASNYTVPGGPADMTAMRAGLPAHAPRGSVSVSVDDPRVVADPEPMAHFPAMLAVARVQASGYHSYSENAYGSGAFSVVTTRDVESDDAVARILKLPGVAGVASINRLLLPAELRNEADLRDAARRVKADILVLYTFDTSFYDRDYAAPLSVVSLGLSPNKRAFVTTTATALITDARTGYVYGGAETTEKSDQAANAWTTDDAVDDTRRRTESRAFNKLIGEIEKSWPNIVTTYAQPTTAPAH